MRLTQLVLVICCLISRAFGLPPAVQMGGAIVAAVEQDAAQDASEEPAATAEQRWLHLAAQQLRQLFGNQLNAEQVANLLDNWTAEGSARGKHHKQKKLLKMLYPLLGAAVLAKVILLPLILKWLTALSASSFVMGKIALAAAGLLALKSIVANDHGSRDRLAIVHASAPALKSYHGDPSSSGSSWMPLRQPYIPLGVTKDGTYRLAQANYEKDLYKPFL